MYQLAQKYNSFSSIQLLEYIKKNNKIEGFNDININNLYIEYSYNEKSAYEIYTKFNDIEFRENFFLTQTKVFELSDDDKMTFFKVLEALDEKYCYNLYENEK